MMNWLKSRNSELRGAGALDEMVRAAREADATDTFSAAARDSILREALRPETADEPLPAMFTPTRRFVVAGALPVVLAVALLVGIDRGVPTPPPVAEGAPVVAVTKHGGEIQFSISNGNRRHKVYRSTDPNSFDAGSAVAVTDGAYVDRLDDQSNLVFYRID